MHKNQGVSSYFTLKTKKKINLHLPLWKPEKSAPINEWSAPAILLFAKHAHYENEKRLKIKIFICILYLKLNKGNPFLTSTRCYGNLRKVPPFLMKSRIFLGFVVDIKWTNFLE